MSTDIVLFPSSLRGESILPSSEIARFTAKTLDLPLVCDYNIKEWTKKKIGNLLIANLPFLYASKHEEIASLVSKAKRVVWLNNDYTCPCPSTRNPKPQSPIRKAFGERKDHVIYWSNRPASVYKKRGDQYVNWNMLSYIPINGIRKSREDCVYYGSYRKGREESFGRYMSGAPGELVVATSTRTAKKFQVLDESLRIRKSLMPLIKELSSFMASLYLEDDDTHENYHSPANRFYEAVAAGTILFIDRRCLDTFNQAGIEVEESWIVDGATSLEEAMDSGHSVLHRIAYDQADAWKKDYRSLLIKSVKSAYKTLL